MNYGDVKKCKNCHGGNIQVVKYIIANGKIQYRHQCMDCGYLDIASIKYASIPKDIDIPLLNEQLRDCYYENNRANFKNRDVVYDDYINSDEWRGKRLEVFELKEEKCAICGYPFNLEVHHLNYDNLGCEEINNYADIVPLCRDCHKKIHDFLESHKDEFDPLKADLFKLRNDYFFSYREAINETVYQYTKNLIWHNRVALKIFLETLYGKYHCKNSIKPYFDSEKVMEKIQDGEIK